jgi:hypothetical protein
MLTKDMRRAERRWRSHCVWMRRLKNDWATHGWNWNWMSSRRYQYTRLGVTAEAACSIWAKTTLCDCFWNPGFAGMGRFKNTPHPRCGYECHPEYSHGMESRPIQEWRELDRSMGDEMREEWKRPRRTPDRMMLVRQTCLCGYLMKKFWKPASEITWGDRRSQKYCPDCKKKFGDRNIMRMPA